MSEVEEPYRKEQIENDVAPIRSQRVKPWRRFAAVSAISTLALGVGVGAEIVLDPTYASASDGETSQSLESESNPEMDRAIDHAQSQIAEQVSNLSKEAHGFEPLLPHGITFKLQSHHHSEDGRQTVYTLNADGMNDAHDLKSAQKYDFTVMSVGKIPEDEALLYNVRSDRKDGTLEFTYGAWEKSVSVKRGMQHPEIGVDVFTNYANDAVKQLKHAGDRSYQTEVKIPGGN
jgi:hypothetical protein